MLPQVDSVLLGNNPRFAALHRDLCANKVNPDGSTVVETKPEKERATFLKDLRTARIESAKKQLIRSGLLQISYKADALPQELQELVMMMVGLFDARIIGDDRDIVQDDLEKLKGDIASLSTSVSHQLQHDAALVSQLLSFREDGLPTAFNTQATVTTESPAVLRSPIAELRQELIRSAASLHVLQSQILESGIRVLEQTMHGSVSRATRAKADYLLAVTEGIAKKLTVLHGQTTSQLYTAGLQEALKQRSGEVSLEIRLLKRQIQAGEDKLDEYRAVRGIEGVANEYMEIANESRRIQDEILRFAPQKGRVQD